MEGLLPLRSDYLARMRDLNAPAEHVVVPVFPVQTAAPKAETDVEEPVAAKVTDIAVPATPQFDSVGDNATDLAIGAIYSLMSEEELAALTQEQISKMRATVLPPNFFARIRRGIGEEIFGVEGRKSFLIQHGLLKPDTEQTQVPPINNTN